MAGRRIVRGRGGGRWVGLRAWCDGEGQRSGGGRPGSWAAAGREGGVEQGGGGWVVGHGGADRRGGGVVGERGEELGREADGGGLLRVCSGLVMQWPEVVVVMEEGDQTEESREGHGGEAGRREAVQGWARCGGAAAGGVVREAGSGWWTLAARGGGAVERQRGRPEAGRRVRLSGGG